ncbi:hypothetical protein [Paenibacillus woosongensis]|uniref:Uncharacterized protein n=1 Tax=Paenibacillus woosongensis TaxID=307580 RepID=A0ABQ4MY26_9BACL|nr:hypothetical protein [Paenibacillus woosongensis]GIP60798.1 hypothetical protein J15TS10_46120 [Paenibacillus woosongensis]
METAIAIYNKIRVLSKTDILNPQISELFIEIYRVCSEILQLYSRIPLVSKIPDKQYFVFQKEKRNSRAINVALFIDDSHEVEKIVGFIFRNQLDFTNPRDITKALYTMAISFCSVIDLFKNGDQKTPGTFFEYFISHWFALMLQIQPQVSIDVLNLDMRTSLPTDCIFDLGPNRPKIHLPVKTSTRERVIQVWAHQRVLDGVYGTGRFLGMLVCLAETKTDKTKLEVTEICLPDQWRLYQMFISQMYRVYYLDIPTKYVELNNIFPPINVKQFGDFFYEIKTLITRG